ncbi:hypothetical protein Trydic_g2863 [Trypoxylus dichotomus]
MERNPRRTSPDAAVYKGAYFQQPKHDSSVENTPVLLRTDRGQVAKKESRYKLPGRDPDVNRSPSREDKLYF